jgi:hypothetical protein
MGMRYESDIGRAAEKISAAAYSMLAAGGTVEEALAALGAGVAEWQAERSRTAEARDTMDAYTAGRRDAARALDSDRSAPGDIPVEEPARRHAA